MVVVVFCFSTAVVFFFPHADSRKLYSYFSAVAVYLHLCLSYYMYLGQQNLRLLPLFSDLKHRYLDVECTSKELNTVKESQTRLKILLLVGSADIR